MALVFVSLALVRRHIPRALPGGLEAVVRLSAARFVSPVVTVQSGIAKGLFSSAQFETWFAGFAAALNTYGARVVGPYVCPHLFAEPCLCKKPNTLLYERAAREHRLNVAESFVIGDSQTTSARVDASEPEGVLSAPAGQPIHTSWKRRRQMPVLSSRRS